MEELSKGDAITIQSGTSTFRGIVNSVMRVSGKVGRYTIATLAKEDFGLEDYIPRRTHYFTGLGNLVCADSKVGVYSAVQITNSTGLSTYGNPYGQCKDVASVYHSEKEEASKLKPKGLPSIGWQPIIVKEFNMRRTVKVQLFDDDKGLDVSESLVADFGAVVTEDDKETTIREIMMERDVKGLLAQHNSKRIQETDMEILQRTGQEVKLRPVKLKDLRWEITPE